MTYLPPRLGLSSAAAGMLNEQGVATRWLRDKAAWLEVPAIPEKVRSKAFSCNERFG
jgi:hypothetical protein